MEILVAVLIFVGVMLAMTGSRTKKVVDRVEAGERSNDMWGGTFAILVLVVVVFFALFAMAGTGALDETWQEADKIEQSIGF